MNETRIILDEQDASDLLTVLYNGKPHNVHTLICLCGATADLRESPKAWNGWQVLPNAKCPRCLQTPAQNSIQLYPAAARARFGAKLAQSVIRKEIA